MVKKITWLFLTLFVLSASSIHAQLAPGSIAPNFTGTDINGNTWSLYDLLDQGKTVIIEVTSTSDESSWNYHLTQTLETLYSTYGPGGTDEMMVFFIEGDGATNTECLYGTAGCNDNSQGDWVEGVSYPIIDDETITDILEVNNFPTVYHICSNRIANEIGLVTNVAEIYSFNGICDEVSGNNNVALLKYTGFEGEFCQETTFAPAVLFQNMGADEITSASFTVSIDGAPFTIENWSGSLSTYQIDTLVFDEITVNSAVTIGIEVTSVNGVADDDASNNTVTGSLIPAIDIDNTTVTLEYTTDDYPNESYWELLDGNGNVIYSGGNSGIFTGTLSPDTYEPGSTNTFELPLPSDGCYRLVVYDAFGDGMCCQYGEGSYFLRDAEGNLLFSGAEFEFFTEHLFEVKNASPVMDNARIALYEGGRGEYCKALMFTPELLVQNVGGNEITALSIEVEGAGATQVIEWTGNLAPSDVATIALNELTFTGDANLTFTITNVNGNADAYDFGNQYNVSLNRVPVSGHSTVDVHLVTDEYGYETYWQIHDDAGTVYAEGGNELVGPDGGGLRIASAGDPGAYGMNETIDVEVELPLNGCYTFLIVDDYGDGMCCEYGEGSFRVSDQDILVLTEGGQYTAFVSANFEIDEVVAAQDLRELTDLKMFPNPVSEELTLNFSLSEAMPLQVNVRNALGQWIQTAVDADFTAGEHRFRINTSNLSDGIYFLAVWNGQKQLSRKFVVQH